MRKIFFTQLTFIFGICCCAQSDPKLVKYLDSLFKIYNNKTSPGCAVTIFKEGKIMARKSYGMASIEHAVAFTHKTVVRLPYSEGREFIAVAAVLIQNDDLLNLNDKVRKYFPKLPQWSEGVTIWDLLNHRSGFADEWATLLMMQNAMSNRFETSQFLNMLYNQPQPEIEPGKGYMYCNSDFGLLRLIMEKVTGKNLPDWIKTRIFEPLKMQNTRMQKNPLDIIPNHAPVYMINGGKLMHQYVQKTSPGGNYFILTNADDLQKWSEAISDPNSEIGKAFNLLLSKGQLVPGRNNHYTVGYSVRQIGGQEVILHEGVNEFNYITRIPSKKVIVITFGNRDYDGFGSENKELVKHLLNVPPFKRPKFQTTPVAISNEEMKEYAGRYRWTSEVNWQGPLEMRRFSEVFIDNNKLKMRYRGSVVIDLTSVGKDLFYNGDEEFGVQIVFKRSGNGAISNVNVEFDDGYPTTKMMRDTMSAWIPSKDELAAFKGKYYNRHLDFYWTLDFNEEGKLVIKRPTIPETIMTPDETNQFHYIVEQYAGVSGDSWMQFYKDEKETITHFNVWSSRLVHHRFDKIQ